MEVMTGMGNKLDFFCCHKKVGLCFHLLAFCLFTSVLSGILLAAREGGLALLILSTCTQTHSLRFHFDKLYSYYTF